MDCERIDEILDAHAVAGLSPAEKAESQAHLTSCRRCADAWLGYETLIAESPPGASADFAGSVLALAVAGAEPRRTAPRRGRPLLWLGLASAAAVVAALSILTNDIGGRRETTAASASTAARSPAASDGVGPDPLPVARFAAGRHYRVLAAPVATASAPGRIEVTEFFMFRCRHCFDFEPALRAWTGTKPGYVDFVRVPALFDAVARLQARAYYTALVLGQRERIVEPFFEEIHVRGNSLGTVAAIRDFFARFGVDGAGFDAAFRSEAVETKLRQAEDLNRRYGVVATPSMAVNGRYVTDGSMAGSNEAMLDVVDALVESEAGDLCPGRDAARCPLR